MPVFRRLLHATDFSPASRPAFSTALDLARDARGELTIVHVITPAVPMIGDGYVDPRVYEQVEAAAREAAERELDKLLKKAKQAGVRARGVLVTGVPHEQIVRAARSRRAQLIVIGTHGRTGLARLFLGSVASRVLAVAPSPVLTVRGR
ncbi:MAG: universal stress protein [Candidatus Rokuibacteriota bacterium]